MALAIESAHQLGLRRLLDGRDKAHEVMHFDVTDKVVKALTTTVKATTNLQNEVNTYQADAQTAFDTATTD